jgi:predicted ester cyclase
VAKWSVLTGRKLKPGSYDDWRTAWQPEEMPPGVKAYILRKVSDPDEVIAFGFFDGTKEEIEALRPESVAEEARQARMALHIESQFADGLYEVVEVVGG